MSYLAQLLLRDRPLPLCHACLLMPTAPDATQDTAQDTYRDASQDALLTAKGETIVALREQLAQANERDRENRRITAALTSRIPAIEAPQELRESPETGAEEPKAAAVPQPDAPSRQEGARRCWWRRVFRG
jgi:hypothetical protein